MKNFFENLILHPILDAIQNHPILNAFCIDEQFFTYQQLGENISKIRSKVRLLNDIYFGLVVNDDIETYASIIALWMEGKAFVPLHPKQPTERNKEIIAQMDIQHILDSSIKTLYKTYEVTSTSKLAYSKNCLDKVAKFDEQSIAYILFTSGSTGQPKGVMISRENLGAFMDSFWDTGIHIDENDRCLQTFDLTFDVSVQSFLTPLTRGACTYTVPHEQIKYSYVYGLLEDHKITFGAFAPSMLRYLKPYFDEIHLPKMKVCIVTAEASPLDLIQEWHECIPNATIYDMYGPTEATIYCTYYKMERNESHKTLNGMLSIGKPFKNIHTIIVGDDQEAVSDGEKGELCVAGEQVTPGYWNNSNLNQTSFFEKEHNGEVKRFYHTGDLCFTQDGDLMLIGRKDSQVKIQGYRVELGEIEFHAREFLKETNVIILPFNNKNNNTELAVLLESKERETSPLMEYLRLKVPPYMVPTKTLFVPKFPINSSDKVDRTKLKTLLQ